MYKELKCPRCGEKLEFIKKENIQFGTRRLYSMKTSEPADFLPCDIYICPECGEYHFLKSEDCPKEELVKCKWCLKMVDPSYPHCSRCGHRFDEEW